MKQLSLFDYTVPETHVILQIANDFGFKIQHYTTDSDETLFAIRDWVAGVSQSENPNDFWQKLKGRLTKAGQKELWTRCPKLPYLATNGKTYQLEFADDMTLFEITTRMDVNTGVRNAVLQYMAKSAAFVDKLRLNKREAAALLNQMADDEDVARGKDVKWIDAREKGIQTRNRFTKTLVDQNPDVSIGQATNNVYQGVFGMKAAELRDMLHLKTRANPRDHMSRLALIYVQLAEEIATIELEGYQDADIVPLNTVYRIVSRMASRAGIQAQEMASELGIDLLTGQKLLR
jgi:DNA-damage-inducible protein D